MVYTAEVLEDGKVWLLNENRRLLSIYDNLEEAREACRKFYKAELRVVDRGGGSKAKDFSDSRSTSES